MDETGRERSMLSEVLQKHGSWTQARFESLLTPEAIEFMNGYVDALNGRGSLISRAIRNSIRIQRPSVIRNAYITHKLFEARAFAERGECIWNAVPGTPEYEAASLDEDLRASFVASPEIHLGATLTHCLYLGSAAARLGSDVTAGDFVYFDWMSSPEQQDLILESTDLCHDPSHDAALASLLGEWFAEVPSHYELVVESPEVSSRFLRFARESMRAGGPGRRG